MKFWLKIQPSNVELIPIQILRNSELPWYHHLVFLSVVELVEQVETPHLYQITPVFKTINMNEGELTMIYIYRKLSKCKIYNRYLNFTPWKNGRTTFALWHILKEEPWGFLESRISYPLFTHTGFSALHPIFFMLHTLLEVKVASSSQET